MLYTSKRQLLSSNVPSGACPSTREMSRQAHQASPRQSSSGAMCRNTFRPRPVHRRRHLQRVFVISLAHNSHHAKRMQKSTLGEAMWDQYCRICQQVGCHRDSRANFRWVRTIRLDYWCRMLIQSHRGGWRMKSQQDWWKLHSGWEGNFC